MAALLTNLGLVATAMFSIVGTAVTTVVENELLLMFFFVALVGSGVRLFQSLRG